MPVLEERGPSQKEVLGITGINHPTRAVGRHCSPLGGAACVMTIGPREMRTLFSHLGRMLCHKKYFY